MTNNYVATERGGWTMIQKNAGHLEPGDILGENLYRDTTLILNKGTVLTEHHIERILQWGFRLVYIQEDDVEPVEETPDVMEEAVVSPESVAKLKRIFFENLTSVGLEHRYGNALHRISDYHWLESIFIKHLSHSKVSRLLNRLRGWDPYTYIHSFDVFILGTLFAKQIGLNNIEEFSLGCLLHDIGKIRIPIRILKKPTKLTPNEFQLIKKHTVFGYDILKENNFSDYVCCLARDHHERMDGSGYPQGLRLNEENRAVKVLGLIDVYSALTLIRPYRTAFDSQTAESILIKECKMVDKKYYYAFFKMLEIFPLHSTVELTNGVQAKVSAINNLAPSYPILHDVHNESEQIKIPLDRSVKVEKIISL